MPYHGMESKKLQKSIIRSKDSIMFLQLTNKNHEKLCFFTKTFGQFKKKQYLCAVVKKVGA